MNILITGSAGFIGFHLVKSLVNYKNYNIIGIDNLNDYYDPNFKKERLRECGIEIYDENVYISSVKFSNYTFIKLDILEKDKFEQLFEKTRIDLVIHLAAQAGVRYSLAEPQKYIDTNIHGFLNVLEILRRNTSTKLIYASSSSVYGSNKSQPFKESDFVNKPVSMYALTKMTNELMAYTYKHLYQVQSIGLRFFTVYGPFGRPDMAPFLFANAILEGKPIKIFNYGKMKRDFTFIDDIVEGIAEIIPRFDFSNQDIYNIGASNPINLEYFVSLMEKEFGKVAIKQYEPMQDGDVEATWADTSALESLTGYNPTTKIETGVHKFANWFKDYFK